VVTPHPLLHTINMAFGDWSCHLWTNGNSCLKGQCHEIFDPWVFNQIIPPRVLFHGLKPFRIWLRIRREIRENRLKWSASAISMRQRNPYKNVNIIFFHQIGTRYLSFPHKTMSEKFGFRIFNDTAEADSEVSMRLRKRIQRSQWDQRSVSAVSMRPQNPLWHRWSLRENVYWPSIPLKG
jgi:hypothetical protein